MAAKTIVGVLVALIVIVLIEYLVQISSDHDTDEKMHKAKVQCQTALKILDEERDRAHDLLRKNTGTDGRGAWQELRKLTVPQRNCNQVTVEGIRQSTDDIIDLTRKLEQAQALLAGK
ncbi:MAG: hypothetical protein Q4P71_00155 [Actinomycetaceae bacterium]|nr:hypothetical protein [Actinomycetaceae bacterium]